MHRNSSRVRRLACAGAALALLMTACAPPAPTATDATSPPWCRSRPSPTRIRRASISMH